jgi:hypothetical protein
MANTFVTGNYYKNECREIVILVTSRTKCFITYKEFWISDLNNCYQDGKVKVRVNENNDEFVLIDGFSKYSSIDEYVKYVKEEEVKETVEDSDLPLTNAIALVGKVTEIKEEVEFTLTDDNKAAIQAIVKLDPVRCNWSNLERIAYSKLTAWVSYPHDSRDIRGVYEGALLVLNTISKEDKARVKELVVEGKKKITLEDSDLPTNAIANNAKDLVLPLTKSLTFKEVREYAENAGYEVEPLGGMFRLIKNNVIKTFPSLKTLQLFITEELVEKKEITLEDSDLPSPDNNAIATVGKVTEVKILTKMVAVNPAVHHEVKLIHDPIFGWQLVGADSQLLREPLNVEDKTQPSLRFKTREGATNFAVKLMAKVKELVEKKELTFKEVQKYAENAGYELTELTNEYCNFSVSSLSDRRGKFTKLIDVVEVIKEGRLLNGEFSNLTLPTDNNAIATEEEKEENKNMLTKESQAAIKLLVKMDFTARGLTQFEVMALNSLRKYIENGIEPKLIKTFAEVLIKKLTPEERLILRDKSLEKVFKGRRLDDVRGYFRTGDNKAKENLKSYIRGVMSEETFLSLCESEGIKKDNAHEASLKWLEFIDSAVGCESWEESWEEFKKNVGFKELKATS